MRETEASTGVEAIKSEESDQIELPQHWQIGIYHGQSPLQISDQFPGCNPVLTKDDISDVKAEFVADPFMIFVDDEWHMFFEVINGERVAGEIGYAVSSDGLTWNYRQIILREPYHLSYPYVFSWEGSIYMIPETLGAGAIRLYRASDFPTCWQFHKTLIEGEFADSSVVAFGGKWWLFTCPEPFDSNALRLFCAESLTGQWVEHPESPLIQSDNRRSRPAGRIIPWNQGLLRFAQDCAGGYGMRVRAFEISCLSPTEYQESEAMNCPILDAGNEDWNDMKMHHIDPHRLSSGTWIACVDGRSQFAPSKRFPGC